MNNFIFDISLGKNESFTTSNEVFLEKYHTMTEHANHQVDNLKLIS